MTEKELIKRYIEQLDEKEKKAHQIAIELLESSFDVSKSIGFLKYKQLNSK
tara:strand:- start:4680 stop:4832 length:153 start_codon:yes stop_codon:yes gene_type:complete